MSVGFQYRERLSGSFHLLESPLSDRAIGLDLLVTVDSVAPMGAGWNGRVTGTITAESLADEAAVEGSIRTRYATERRQVYDLWFRTCDDEVARLRVQKDFFLHSALDALTVVDGTLFDTRGEEMGRTRMRFDVRADLGPMLRSLRLRLGGRVLGRRALSLGLLRPRLRFERLEG